MYNLELAHYKTCLPDYFSGDSRPHLQVPVYKGMILEEIKSGLIDELNQGFIGGNWELSEDEDYCAAVESAIEKIKPTDSSQTTFFNDLEDDGEMVDSVYAYFLIVDLEE